MAFDPSDPLLAPSEHVLSTLEADGRRRWLFPRLAKGKLWQRRRVVAYLLLAIYSGLPWLRIAGEPAVLLDVPRRTFHVFGFTFLPTDTVLLALALVLGFLCIIAATALIGRVWCGWACPQTVYMEFVFRPLERVFLGRAGRGGTPRKDVPAWRRILMYATYLVICLHLAQTFMAYFVGADNVRQWIWGSPFEHPAAFLIVLGLTVLMMLDFAFWREQLCIIGCPYGRFQSVMLDRCSKVVAYDSTRGEPRKPLKKSEREAAATAGKSPFDGRGSCVSCNLCVQVCPTGIDIRDGLQLECVNCTQCIDACNDIMDRTEQPHGLIRVTSEAELAGEPQRIVRPRVVVYCSLIGALAILFLSLLITKPEADVMLMRGIGRPFHVTNDGSIENTMRIKVTNRTREARRYRFEMIRPAGLSLRGLDQEFVLAPGETRTEPLHVVAPPATFSAGRVEAALRIVDNQDWSIEKTWRLLGPMPGAKPPSTMPEDAGATAPAGTNR